MNSTEIAMGKQLWRFVFLLILLPTFGMAQSIGVELGLGMGKFESDLADQEKLVIESLGLYRIFIHNETEEEVEVPLDYSYLHQSASIGVLYYPVDHHGFGLMYQFLDVEQRYDFPSDFSTFESSESYTKAHSIGPLVKLSLLSRGRSTVSLSIHGYRLTGSLWRVPVVVNDYSDDGELVSFFQTLNQEVELKGWGYSIGPKVELIAQGRMNVFFKVLYDYSKVDLKDDPFPGYIKNSESKGTVFTAGLALIIDQ